ncbi:MAG: DNA-processing protein DprA [Marinobacter sp.]|uniref:DNA-processing protein DprA n=1 Tax=Marinobacter sp. TaxID=50741 RepID=UPI0034A0751E
MTSPQTSELCVSPLFDAPQGRWLALSLLPGLGAKRWHVICEHLDTPVELLAMEPATLRSLGLPSTTCETILAWQQQDLRHQRIAKASDIWQRCQSEGIQLVTQGCEDFPEMLQTIHDAPFVLYVKGDSRLLNCRQIGIVGSRNATRSGLDHARQFAAALSQRGYLVTSGMALGVDGEAHTGALDAGYATIAVIGTGVDVVYPRQHRELAARIVENGAIVSDFPPGTAPKAAHFPQRNRLISGLSQGVLVVEASPRSGSLITARLALEQGREVFAIPSSIHNPLARGCHHLIRQGAKLVESVADIEEELTAWWSANETIETVPIEPRALKPGAAKPSSASGRDLLSAPACPDHLGEREIAVLNALGYDPVSTDDLCVATGLPANELMQSLLMLEMEGLADAAPGGFQRVV